MDSKEDWILAAKKELGGKDPFESLGKSWDEFKIQPYYDNSDLSLSAKTYGRQRNAFGAPNHWLNLPEVDCAVAENSNGAALNHLQNGADGIFFKIDARSEPSILLAAIKPEYCFLGFESDASFLPFFERLAGFISPNQLNGSIFWNSSIKWLPIANLFKDQVSFRCFGIAEKGEGVVEQISNYLETAIEILVRLTDYAFSAKTVFNQLAFTINSTHDFFGDLIRIRALRILLNRLATSFDLENATSFIRIKVNPSIADVYQPHGDLLANSFAAIAAVISSADAVTVENKNQQSDLHSRTARNISLLLREESRLDKVVDPFAGSYFIESLTHSLVEKVWIKITTNEARFF